MQKIILLASILMAVVQLRAQRTISGKVTDEKGEKLIGAAVQVKFTTKGVITDFDGKYSLVVPNHSNTLVFSYIGYTDLEILIGASDTIDVLLSRDTEILEEVAVIGYKSLLREESVGSVGRIKRQKRKRVKNSQTETLPGTQIQGVPLATFDQALQGKTAGLQILGGSGQPGAAAGFVQIRGQGTLSNTPPNYLVEQYAPIVENRYHDVWKSPYSTFSIDVDGASYSNMRRFVNYGGLPPKDAVRIEEFINYFSYEYEIETTEDAPFGVQAEVGPCPWNRQNKLLHVGIKAGKVDIDDMPSSNFVFLLDVSGSMQSDDKLPLVKKTMEFLVQQLRPEDRVAIVVYAGASGLVLKSTPGSQKNKIMSSIEKLEAGGSTAGGAGIRLAYSVAVDNFIEGGNNRVILATDGDFNVGIRNENELTELIEKKRETGVFLSCLGYGRGNIKDAKLELLANKGNGSYYYIDGPKEARKVMVDEMGGTLLTVAKDVKLQMEFNPVKVAEYRLVGYENRMLETEDFEDDKKDAGEIGAGHTVTAIYEIIPADPDIGSTGVSSSYFDDVVLNKKALESGEFGMLRIRYKAPDENISKLMTFSITNNKEKIGSTSDDFRFSAAVAMFGLYLRDSQYKGSSSPPTIIALAKGALGKDEFGHRKEFIKIVKSAPPVHSQMTADR